MTDHKELIERLRRLSYTMRTASGEPVPSIFTEAADALSRAQEEMEGLRRDAGRYRWLITRGVFKCDPKMDGMHQWYPIAVPLKGNTLDAAIDSEMGAQK